MDGFSDKFEVFVLTTQTLQFNFLSVSNQSKLQGLQRIRGGAVGSGTLQAGRRRIRFPMMSLEIFIDTILPTALYHWGRRSL
jgi:hypothetical protein